MMKQKFISVISEWMQPWQPGKVPVYITSAELMTFAGNFMPLQIEQQVEAPSTPSTVHENGRMEWNVVEDAPATILIRLTVEDISEAMQDMNYRRDVRHSILDGVQVKWMVAMKDPKTLI